jgi:hypothetical protein
VLPSSGLLWCVSWGLQRRCCQLHQPRCSLLLLLLMAVMPSLWKHLLLLPALHLTAAAAAAPPPAAAVPVVRVCQWYAPCLPYCWPLLVLLRVLLQVMMLVLASCHCCWLLHRRLLLLLRWG